LHAALVQSEIRAQRFAAKDKLGIWSQQTGRMQTPLEVFNDFVACACNAAQARVWIESN